MGEIAEMMLNGLMCEGCGVWMDDFEEPGYPRRCAGCRRSRGEADSFDEDLPSHLPRNSAKKIVACPNCKRRFRTHDAYLAHWRAKHAPSSTESPPGMGEGK